MNQLLEPLKAASSRQELQLKYASLMSKIQTSTLLLRVPFHFSTLNQYRQLDLLSVPRHHYYIHNTSKALIYSLSKWYGLPVVRSWTAWPFLIHQQYLALDDKFNPPPDQQYLKDRMISSVEDIDLYRSCRAYPPVLRSLLLYQQQVAR